MTIFRKLIVLGEIDNLLLWQFFNELYIFDIFLPFVEIGYFEQSCHYWTCELLWTWKVFRFFRLRTSDHDNKEWHCSTKYLIISASRLFNTNLKSARKIILGRIWEVAWDLSSVNTRQQQQQPAPPSTAGCCCCWLSLCCWQMFYPFR